MLCRYSGTDVWIEDGYVRSFEADCACGAPVQVEFGRVGFHHEAV